jgi:hypothetical protein
MTELQTKGFDGLGHALVIGIPHQGHCKAQLPQR